MSDTSARSRPLPRGLERPVAGLAWLVRSVAFWLAVLLPAAYPVALVVALEALPALLVSHTVAVALGHGHRPSAVRADD